MSQYELDLARLAKDEQRRMQIFGYDYEPLSGWDSPEAEEAYKAAWLGGGSGSPAVGIEGAPPAEQLADASDPKPVAAENPKDTESRRWMLTLPEGEYEQAEVEKKLGKYKATIGQLEAAPTTGYKHWQLYLETKTALRFSTLRKLFPRGHYEPAVYPRINCVRYCTDETKSAGVSIRLGALDFAVRQGKRTDIDSYIEQVMMEGKSADEVIFDDPRASKVEGQLRSLELIRDRQSWGVKFREVEVHYIHGNTRTGKTSALFETYGYAGVYRVSNWKNPFDGYKGQDVLLLDEYNTSVPIVDMLKILEGYPLEVSARYADKIAKFTKVFIVSNLALEDQHLTIQQEHPKQWDAFKARLTSVSEMTIVGAGDDARAEFRVAKGTPPQLDHFITGKPVRIAAPSVVPALAVSEPQAVDEFEADDFFFDED